jgi:hypothetical protein
MVLPIVAAIGGRATNDTRIVTHEGGTTLDT